MIVLAATMKAKQGKEAELENTLKAVIPKVEQEKGTLQYVLHRSQSDAGKFFFYEKYKDKQTLERHSNTPYLLDTFKRMNALISEKPQVELFEEIASIADQK